MAREVAAAYVRGKQHCIIIVAEGARPDAHEIATRLEAQHAETALRRASEHAGPHPARRLAPGRRSLSGHRLGAAAVAQLAQGEGGMMVGLVAGAVTTTPLAEVAERMRELDTEHCEMAQVLAR